MEWDNDIDLTKRKTSSQLIVKRVLGRGWRICGFKTNPAIFLIYIPGKEEPVQVFSASPPQTSYAASKIAKDKYITNQILSKAGIPVPNEMLVELNNYDKAKLNEFLTDNKTLVVKPLDSAHGKGITVNVNTIELLEEAIKRVSSVSNRDIAIIQEQIYGIDLRVICIDYKYICTISRDPASIIGDGAHSVRDLVKITNQSEERGENYSKKLNVIPIDRVEQFLTEEQLAVIPDKNQKVQVIGVSNLGMGGISSDLTDEIPQDLIDLALLTAKVAKLPVAGIDFLVSETPTKNSSMDKLKPKVIEINECPSLCYSGLRNDRQNNLLDSYLDCVAKD